MRVLIQNSGYHLKNYGDLAMLVSAYEQILSLHPNADVRIFTSDPAELKLHCPKASAVPAELGLRWAEGGLLTQRIVRKLDRTFPKWASFWMTRKMHNAHHVRLIEKVLGFYNFSYHRQIAEFWHEVKAADIVIATGGGFLTTTFFGQGRAVLMTMALAKEMDKKTAFFGQGVGPFQGSFAFMEEHVMEQFKQSSYVGFREKKFSSIFVEKYSLTNTRFTFDDAAMLASKEKVSSEKRPNQTLGVNLRIAEYSGLNHKFIEDFAQILTQVTGKSELKLVPLPIALGQQDSDSKALQQLAEESKLNFQTPIDLDSVDAILERVALCSVIVTCSYHAGVFGACNGIPVILISANGYYDQKLLGLQDAFEGKAVDFICLNEESWPERLQEAILGALSSETQNEEAVSEQIRYYSRLAASGYEDVFSP